MKRRRRKTTVKFLLKISFDNSWNFLKSFSKNNEFVFHESQTPHYHHSTQRGTIIRIMGGGGGDGG